MRILSGLYKGRSLVAPKGEKTRPTLAKVRGALFDSLQGDLGGGRFLDLFAGSGAMGFEAMSRGVDYVCWVEESPRAIRCILQNVEQLQIERSRGDIQKNEVFLWLEKVAPKQPPFDWIFADPPYGAGYSRLLVETIDKRPLFKAGGAFFVETTDLLEGVPLQNMQLKRVRDFGKTAIYEYRLL